jgi:hypothetical protein
MQEPQPSMTPPPFDWTRYQPPGPNPTLGGSPPPSPPPSSPGGGDRRRHPAHRARIAAAVLAGTAFGGLLGATAFSRSSDASTTQPTDDDTASTGVPRDTTDGEPFDREDDPYNSYDPYGAAPDDDDAYGDDDAADGWSSQQRPEPPAWGGSAQPGGDDSATSGPTLRSQGS